MSTITIQLSTQELAQLIEAAVDSAMERKLAKWFQAENVQRKPINFVWDQEGQIKPDVAAQLQQQLIEVEAGERGIPFTEALSILGLDKDGNSLQI